MIIPVLLWWTRKDRDKLSEELGQRKFLGFWGLLEMHEFTEDIKLDDATAYPLLAVSEDGKLVKCISQMRDVPDNPERFDSMRAVLGQNSFSDGQHYWEVDVGGKNWWKIGLCLDSVKRKGVILTSPENGFWVLSLLDGAYRALSSPPICLNVPTPPSRVGIFL
ncbi:butyrophilin subfamily 3 member A1-like [Nycticebus coucang]|uniref:butyrophilin subfamily 3 member A1-like n=1 Tax=Nycticebus coucang TaxID=9470 RepID=UPI00234DE364|nr:butyrophilin subfamily 3 member A1-like [Nycticebus coucang]